MNSTDTLASNTATASLCNRLHNSANDNLCNRLHDPLDDRVAFYAMLRGPWQRTVPMPPTWRHSRPGAVEFLPHPRRWLRTLPPPTCWPPQRYDAASRPLLTPTRLLAILPNQTPLGPQSLPGHPPGTRCSCGRCHAPRHRHVGPDRRRASRGSHLNPGPCPAAGRLLLRAEAIRTCCPGGGGSGSTARRLDHHHPTKQDRPLWKRPIRTAAGVPGVAMPDGCRGGLASNRREC
jgi:hypothetical protein